MQLSLKKITIRLRSNDANVLLHCFIASFGKSSLKYNHICQLMESLQSWKNVKFCSILPWKNVNNSNKTPWKSVIYDNLCLYLR